MTFRLLHELPPKENNPRNSEGSFLRAPDGSILFAYSRFTGSSGDDHCPCDIALIRSFDEGETWTKDSEIIAPAAFFGVQNVMSVSSMTLLDGSLCFFFLIKENDGTSTVGRTVSADGGKTFTPSRCVCDFEKAYYVINNDRFIRLTDGRIAAPASWHNNTNAGKPGEIMLFVSDDDGYSFREAWQSRLVCADPNPQGFQEPGIRTLPDGRFFLWMRTALGCQYACRSDTVNIFPTPAPTEFISPCAPMSVLPDGNTYYAVYANTFDGNPYGPRTPLVIRVSTDGAETFGEPQIIESDPRRNYAYTAGMKTRDGAILLAYVRGDREKEDYGNGRVGIAKITL